MQKILSSRLLRLGFPLLVPTLLLALGPGQEASSRDKDPDKASHALALARMLSPGTADLQLIVELNEPSVIERLAAEDASLPAYLRAPRVSGRPLDPAASRAGTQRARIQSEQRTVMQRLASFGDISVEGTTDTVLNAVIVRVPFARFQDVQTLPGIKKVYVSRDYRMTLDAAATVHNAQGMWDRAGGSAQAGAGVKIGIIDTGIDIANPMFQDDTLTPPAGFPKGETDFTTQKVIAARNYISLLRYAQTVNTAIDEVGHGSFVAGCAAGKQVAAPGGTIGGMAQGAFLGSYKVFGTPGINNYTTGAAILAAINDAVNDGMNVLNLSLGGLSYVPAAQDPESVALTNAIAAGVVVVLAAGNDGEGGSYTISSPGSTPDAITVGSVTNAHRFIYRLRATGPGSVPSSLQNIPYVEGQGLSVAPRISSTAIVDVATIGPDGLACQPLTAGSLSGKVAFISRGGDNCYFTNKLSNAANAGAIAAVVYNNVAGAAPFTMGGVSGSTIPGVMISNTDGLALKEFLAANPAQATVEIDALAPVVEAPRILSDFSSRGPTAEFNLKPDLVAVGEYVYSAAQKNNPNGVLYNSSRFMVSQGTSFSTPMVAGAAAVMKQLFPSFTPQDIKSALTTTTDRTITLDGTNPADLLQAGAGLLDMAKAATVAATFAPSSLSFGANPYSSGMSSTRTITIKNVSSTGDTFTLTVEPLVSGPSVVLSRSNTGAIPSQGTAAIDVTISPSAPMTGAFQGYIAVQSTSSSAIYRIPYWSGIYVPDGSRILTVSGSGASGGTQFSSLARAIASARPGNVVEIADSGTYPAGLILATNDQGLPLHGITIRATAGKTPTLTGAGIGAPADLYIVGLRDVLLQGLTISGGSIGVSLEQVSTSQPVSLTVDHCNITDMSDSGLGVGVWASGGTVSILQSTIARCSDSGLVADDVQLKLIKSIVDSNQFYDGMEVANSNVQILHSTISNNSGPGAALFSCSGTIEGSSFVNNTASLNSGDGLYVQDGRVTISNNTISENASRGIALLSGSGSGGGTSAAVRHNIVRSNGSYGIYANPAQNLLLDGNLIKANGVGIRLNGASAGVALNNIVINSAGAFSALAGSGIALAGGSSLRLVNNTIVGNNVGVNVEAGSSVPVWNSILWSNTTDATGLRDGDIQNSLVGSAGLATGTNITGDPKFVDAANDNFEPGTGSPALDAGSNTVADMSFLDFNQHLRVASAGARPGEGTADIGAVEAGSRYPLVFPLLANGQEAPLGDDFITGFAVLNNGKANAQAVFSAYGQAGALLGAAFNPSARTFGAGAQVPILGHELFGYDFVTSQIGAVLAASESKLTGFFLLFDRDFKRFADGVDVSDSAATTLSFLRHQQDSNGHTSYCVFNPGVDATKVTATLYNTSGNSVGNPKTGTIAPKGQYVFSFDEVTLSSGYVRVQSDRPVAGLELFGNAKELSALRAAPAASDGLLYFPHFAVNSGFSTVIGIVNATVNPSSLVLTAYNSDGTQIGAPVSRALPVNGQVLESVAGLFGLGGGALTTGYIVATGDGGGLAGFTGFRFDDGRVQSAAAVPATSIPRTNLIFSHIAHQVAAGAGGTYQTGIALLNPFGVPVQYTMKVFDGTGAMKAELTSTIGAGQKISRVLSHPVAGAGFFRQALPLSGGHIEVTCDVGLIGFELFYTEDVSQLASVPAQTP